MPLDSNFVEPPRQPGDTQPNRPLAQEVPRSDDTQPIDPETARRARVRRRRLIALAGTVVTIALVALAAVVIINALDSTPEPARVTLSIDGERRTLTTEAETVAALLTEQDVSIDSGDVLSIGLTEPIRDGMTIALAQARTVSVTIDGQTSFIRTLEENPQDILELAGVDLRSADRVLLDGVEADINNLILWPVPVVDIVIQKAISVTIVDGAETIRLNTVAATVGDALFEAGVSLFLADTVAPDMQTPLEDNMEIVVDRSKALTVVGDGDASRRASAARRSLMRWRNWASNSRGSTTRRRANRQAFCRA